MLYNTIKALHVVSLFGEKGVKTHIFNKINTHALAYMIFFL